MFCVFADDAQVLLHELDMEIAQAKRSAYASGTGQNFLTQWRAFLLFCCFCSLNPLPISVNDLCRYIMFLAQNMQVYQTVKNYLNGVRVLHLCHDLPFSLLQHFEVRLVLQSVKRRLRQAPFAKLPIEPNLLRAIYSRLDMTSSLHASLWCSFLFAFFGFLRKSNVVPTSLANFDRLKHLSRDSITLTSYGLVLRLLWGKTNQYKERVLELPLVAIPGDILDPVGAFKHMCTLAPAHAGAPAFAYRTASGTLDTITYSQFTRQLLSLLKALGVDADKYGGHSFRRGGCTWAFRAGVPPELLKLHGDWRSMCYVRYLEFSTAQRLLVTRKMAVLMQEV